MTRLTRLRIEFLRQKQLRLRGVELGFVVCACIIASGVACRPTPPTKPQFVQQPQEATPKQPAPAAEAHAPSSDTSQAIRISSEEVSVGPEDWLRIEDLRSTARAGWISGSISVRDNAVTIESDGVESFTLYISRLDVDWDQRVIISIDGQRAELRRGESGTRWFELSEAGRWRSIVTERSAP